MCSPVSYELFCFEEMPDSFTIIKHGKVVTCRNPYRAHEQLSFAPVVFEPLPPPKPKPKPEARECFCPLSVEFDLGALPEIEDPSEIDFNWLDSSHAA